MSYGAVGDDTLQIEPMYNVILKNTVQVAASDLPAAN